MTDPSVSPVANVASTENPDEAFNRILTEGILQAAKETDLHDVELAMEPCSALSFSGTVLPMMPAVLTEEERRALSEALGI